MVSSKGKPMKTVAQRNTVSVFARHKDGCLFYKPGDRECRCGKYLLVYESDQKRNRMASARTTSWTEAEARAQEMRDSWNPEKIELQQLRAKRELEQISLIDAVSLYLVDKESRLGKNSTVELARCFWGDIDPATKELKREGKFFSWIASQPSNQRPAYVRDVTAKHLTDWRAAWTWNDLTRSVRWNLVKTFFHFCEAQGWITDNPARKLKPLKARKGNRTAIFTDQQYADILDAVHAYDPEFQPASIRKHWQRRIRAFLELLRWSGMDLVDAVEFRQDLITGDVLRYRRKKTGELATLKLPAHVIAALRSVPVELGCTQDQPFRTQGTVLESNTWKWGYRLTQLFKLAGITEVRTGFRVRTPHAKMLRDTAAVWWLRHGVPIHSVSKALGHSSVLMTERAYLPWVKELEEAHLDQMDKVMAAAAPAAPKGVVRMRKA